MAIPKLSSYDMPSSALFPQNKAAWTFEPARAVLLIHDMQDYFLDFYPEGSPLVTTLMSAIVQLKQHCQARGMKVIYTAQPIHQAPTDRGLLTDLWGRGIDLKPERQSIAAELTPGSDDLVLTKWRYSAFQKSDLAALMKEWNKDQMLICGIYGHIGCLMTAAHAFMLDIKPFLVGDAIADFSREEHLMALQYTATRCGYVTNMNEVLST